MMLVFSAKFPANIFKLAKCKCGLDKSYTIIRGTLISSKPMLVSAMNQL